MPNHKNPLRGFKLNIDGLSSGLVWAAEVVGRVAVSVPTAMDG